MLALLVVVTLSARADASPGSQRPACDLQVSCFVLTSRGVEWRIVDPRRSQAVALAVLPSTPSFVGWSETGEQVEYLVGRSLFRAGWRARFQPTEIMRLPEHPESCDWWFNPDSSAWQFVTERAAIVAPEGMDPGDGGLFRCELWQSTRTGLQWRMVRADTGMFDMEACGLADSGSSSVRRAHVQTPDEVSPPLGDGGEDSEIAGQGSGVDEGGDLERWYHGVDSTGSVGIEFSLRWASIEGRTLGPVTLVDSRTARRYIVPRTGDENAAPDSLGYVFLREACGWLLLQDTGGRWQLLDVRTTRACNSLPADAHEAYWCPRLN
ncbi:MAG: hypothetical protein ABL977_07400 [Candidatus Eisenbacteria bacterium]